MNQEVKKEGPKPLYELGFLGLIPIVGFFVGFGLTLCGIVKYKDKKLIIIGIACMVVPIIFTAIVFSTLFYAGFKSDSGKNLWGQHAQMDLNALVKEIEFYKLEHGQYPDSLQQLDIKDEFVVIWDPTQSMKNGKTKYFNYKNLGNKYLLFSSGVDGIPNTDDDIFPKIESINDNIGWTKEP